MGYSSPYIHVILRRSLLRSRVEVPLGLWSMTDQINHNACRVLELLSDD